MERGVLNRVVIHKMLALAQFLGNSHHESLGTGQTLPPSASRRTQVTLPYRKDLNVTFSNGLLGRWFEYNGGIPPDFLS